MDNFKKEIFETKIKRDLETPYFHMDDDKEITRINKLNIHSVSYVEKEDTTYVFVKMNSMDHYAYVCNILDNYYELYGIDYLIYNNESRKRSIECEPGLYKQVYEEMTLEHSKTFNKKRLNKYKKYMNKISKKEINEI